MLEFGDKKAQLVAESPMALMRAMINKDQECSFSVCSGLILTFGKLRLPHTDSSTFNRLWVVVDLVWPYFPFHKEPL